MPLTFRGGPDSCCCYLNITLRVHLWLWLVLHSNQVAGCEAQHQCLGQVEKLNLPRSITGHRSWWELPKLLITSYLSTSIFYSCHQLSQLIYLNEMNLGTFLWKKSFLGHTQVTDNSQYESQALNSTFWLQTSWKHIKIFENHSRKT